MPKTKKGKTTTIKKKATTKKTQASRKAVALRDGKGAKMVELLQRNGGATLTELTEATGWQKHSVRGFLSAVVGKKMGLKLTSAKREDGERVYAVAS